MSGNKTGNGETGDRLRVIRCQKMLSDEMIYFSIFGMETSLGEWPTQGKLTPVIVSPFYEPLDSLAVSNFY